MAAKSMCSHVTPRRSPRLVALKNRSCSSSSTVTTPVRELLAAHMGKQSVLVDLKHFLEESTTYSTLEAQLVKAETELNKVRKFVIVSRKLKCFDPKIGPYDAIKVIVKEDGRFSLQAYDKVIEEGNVEQPFASSYAFMSVLQRMANPLQVIHVCKGIHDYSSYQVNTESESSRRVVIAHCPPNSCRDIHCPIMYEKTEEKTKSSKRKSGEVGVCSCCSHCQSLKWQLTRRKRQHDALTPAQKMMQQSSNSKVPFDALSPCSKKARMQNMSSTIHNLRVKLEYNCGKSDRLSATTSQNNDIGQLVNCILDSSDGKECLKAIFEEADDVSPGLGNEVKETWDRDISDWKQFLEDQENNGTV